MLFRKGNITVCPSLFSRQLVYKILEHQLFSCFLNSNISCFAEVQVAQVCLEQCELAIPEIYKKVPVLAAIKLINQTLLPKVFEWGDVSSLYLPLFFKEDKSDPHLRNSGLFKIDMVDDDDDILETCKDDK